jgi:aspartokinase-like uncharacterized kinase
MNDNLQIVKVGGSLFCCDEMPARVHAWLEGQPPGTTLFIGGGGDLVQPLRTAHERFRLSDEASHWLAVRAMTVTSRLLAKLLNVELVEQFGTVVQLADSQRPAACVLDVEEFLLAREPHLPGCRLPRDWSCSSDSIAARVAAVLAARRLVLLKSVPYPDATGLTRASTLGLVDGHFPTAAADLPELCWINLLVPDLEEQRLPPEAGPA